MALLNGTDLDFWKLAFYKNTYRADSIEPHDGDEVHFGYRTGTLDYKYPSGDCAQMQNDFIEIYNLFYGGEFQLQKPLEDARELKHNNVVCEIDSKDQHYTNTMLNVAKKYGYVENKASITTTEAPIRTIKGASVNETHETPLCTVPIDKHYHIDDIPVTEYGYPAEGYAQCYDEAHLEKYLDSHDYTSYIYTETTDNYVIEVYSTERTWEYDAASDMEAYNRTGDESYLKEASVFEWVTYEYYVYKYPDYERTDYDKRTFVKKYIVEYIIRNHTTEELIARGLLNPDGTLPENVPKCSKKNDKERQDNPKCCSNCRRYVERLVDLLSPAYDDDFETYTPYIANVKNHWYRDVYFALENENQQFVQVDEEYEAIMGERWTLYETDENDQYILYVLDVNGDYAKISEDSNDANVNKVREMGMLKETEEGYYMFMGTQQDAQKITNRTDYSNDSEEVEAISIDIPVAKKAVTATINQKDADGDSLINWNENNGVWSAYQKESDKKSTGWQRLYEDSEDELEQKLYINITTQYDIVQIEEGQRAQTNSKIKNLFLNNTYFRYDGSPETADVIEALRKEISPTTEEEDRKYGALTSNDLNTSVVLDTDEDGENEEYTVKDYAGKVELTQNSLAAFSMLENTHTLDADFIYKDFKELVVELGYFTKEELSDETPRIFAWLIPEIGSYGFPIASLDKKENEYGTQIHSKADYEANEQNTIQAILNDREEDSEETNTNIEGTETTEQPTGPQNPPDSYLLLIEEDSQTSTDIIDSQSNDNTKASTETEGITSQDNTEDTQVSAANLNVIPKKSFKDVSENIIGQIASLDTTPISNLKTVGAIRNVPPASKKFNQTNPNPSMGTKTGELNFNGVDYECWHQTEVTCTLYSFAFVAHAYTGEPIETYLKETAPYWSGGLNGNAFGLANVDGTYYGNTIDLPSVDECAEFISEALAQGKPVYFYSGFESAGGCHAVVLLGANEAGKLLYYDPWPGIIEEYGSATDFATNLTTLLNTGVKENGGHLYSFFIPKEIPEGAALGSTDYYKGFEGGEAVVSPVTGILLEYGKYIPGKIDPLTEKESRVNVDFQYMDSSTGVVGAQGFEETAQIPTEEQTSQVGTDSGDEPTEKKEKTDVIDYVGYAKIMILDDETYLELENQMKNSASQALAGMKDKEGNVIQSLVDKDGNYLENRALKLDDIVTNEDETKNWLENDITLYGYKEFAEMYSDFKVSGNIIFIDGFECELPPEGGTNTDANTEQQQSNVSGQDIDLQYFINEASNADFDKNLYEKEQKYSLSSKDATNKLNNENEMKAATDSIVLVGTGEEQKILIKEGTIIGRTMTNDELVKTREANGIKVSLEENAQVQDQNANENSDNDTAQVATYVQGNYLRIIMRDEDDTIVENVEEYMKLDTEGSGSKEGIYGDLEAIDENSTDAEKVRTIISYFKGEGFTTEAAAGIVGNLIQESTLDPSVVSDAGYTGLAQWSETWFPKQKEWMESNGYNSDSFAGQVRSIYESGHTGGMNEDKWEELKGLTDVRQATELFCVHYEACVGGEDETEWYHTGNKYQHLNQRKQYAQNAYDIYMGDDSIGLTDK